MYPLFESIRIEDGKVHLLEYHQARLEQSFLKLFNRKCSWNLKNILPNIPKTGLQKLRFLYNETAYYIEVLLYEPREIKTLKLIEIGDYSYTHKWTDRSEIDAAFAQRGNCDDVLMTRKGYLTDTSYCNVILFDGKRWLTPEKPLFDGVQRQFLMDQKKISPQQIRVSELHNFQSFILVNAMIPMTPNCFVSIEGIQ